MGKKSDNKSLRKYDIDFTQKLGKGAFGVVYPGIKKKSGKKVAVKVLDTKRMSEDQISSLSTEASILSSASNENYVVGLYDSFLSGKTFYMTMEYCTGDFQQILDKFSKKYFAASEVWILPWMIQIFAAIAFIHEKGIIHRDIKPANYLVTAEDGYKRIKLADFGLATYCEPNSLISGGGGTPVYMAPERLRGEAYNTKSDVFSVGCVFAQLLNQGRHPFYEAKGAGFLKKKLLKADISEFSKAKKNSWFKSKLISAIPNRSPDAIALLKKCITTRHESRWTAKKCSNHPWFKKTRRSDGYCFT